MKWTTSFFLCRIGGMKQIRIIVISAVVVLAVAAGSFGLYVYTVAHPSAPVLTESESAEFESVCSSLYPRQLIHDLPYPVTPAELNVHSESAILIDASNGCVLYEKNADDIIPPASMTKLVVMYVTFQEIASRRISLDDIVPLPPESWAVNAPPLSSLMFLGEGQTVTLRELMLGMAVASGNDAAVAVAHYVSGSVDAFVQRMNEEMAALGLVHTRFVEPSGYSEQNLTTPREFAAFARVYIERYPEALSEFHSQRSIAYPQEHNLASWHKGTGSEPPIVQASTNKLLDVLPGCDGLKTGFIFESGYNLSLTVQRDGTRFISVTMKGPGSGSVVGNKYRVEDSVELMEWAFTCFATLRPEEIPAVAVPVLGGSRNETVLVPVNPEPLTVPAVISGLTAAEAAARVTCSVQIPPYIDGSEGIGPGKVCGKAVYILDGIVLQEVPLAAARQVSPGNAVKRLVDRVAAVFF